MPAQRMPLIALLVALGCSLDPVSIADEQVDGGGDGGDGMVTTRGDESDDGSSASGSEAGTVGDATTTMETTGGSDDAGSGSGTTTGDSDGGTTFGGLEDCQEVVAAFDAETAAIRSCSDAPQCGQVLAGTSCGCTREWVARLDADLTQWEALIAIASDMECSIGFGGPCDCPAADGYACVDDTCTWNYL